MKYSYFLVVILISVSSISQNLEPNVKEKPNVLFISVDDLRPDLGCYGKTFMKTPNMDKLASEGILFQNHYVQVPTCGASRACLLTGMRPRRKAELQNNVAELEISNQPERDLPESFIHHLRRNGYYTVGIGKISHSPDGLVYGYEEAPSTKRELPYSWDELVFNSGKWKTGWNSFFGYANGENRQSMKKQVKPYEAGEVDDDGYVDGLTAELAITKLRELKDNPKPFFLGVGFFKPHLPFNSPKKYWDLYNRDSIPISPNPTPPKNVNLASLHKSGEFGGFLLGGETANLKHQVSDAYAKKIRQAYYASISYVDAQIGKLLNELEALKLNKNTIVILWGDHGWHLGDQQIWGKHTLFDNALKSVLIVKIPGSNQSGKKIKTIVETVDIYPTLMELCQVKMPFTIDGESFINLLKTGDDPTNSVAYSFFTNGISLETERYHLIKYFRKEMPSIELYDHLNDPIESINIAQDKPDIVKELMPFIDEIAVDYWLNNKN